MELEKYTDIQTKNGKPTGLRTAKFKEVPTTGISNNTAKKQEALEKATVTVSSGKVFYADTASRADMSDAIAIGTDMGEDSIMWKLAEPFEDGKWALVTMAEMKEARYLALTYKGQIIS